MTSAAIPMKIDWRHEFEGAGGLSDLASNLRYQMHFLLHDIEDAFDRKRAVADRSDVDGILTFRFSEDSVAATEWLSGQAWSTARKLTERMQAINDAMDAEADTLEVALARAVKQYFEGSTPESLDAEHMDGDAKLLRLALQVLGHG